MITNTSYQQMETCQKTVKTSEKKHVHYHHSRYSLELFVMQIKYQVLNVLRQRSCDNIGSCWLLAQKLNNIGGYAIYTSLEIL